MDLNVARQGRAATTRPSTLGSASAIIETVSATVLETLGTIVGADTPLMSAGLDSIAATDVANELSKRVDAELPQTLLFDHPTTGAAASFVAAVAPPAATGPEEA